MVKILTNNDINHRTFVNRSWQKQLIRNYENITKDPEKENRLKLYFCKKCYYTNGQYLAGQGFTQTNCISCGVEMLFPNTLCDALCEKCAMKYKACRHCHADLNDKNRKE